MAKILYAPGIEEVSGALSKIKTKSQHRDDQNMFLATHRKAATQSLVCSRAYYRKINTLPWHANDIVLSANTLELRNEFIKKQAAIKTRKVDLMTMASDQAAYIALRDEMVAKSGIKPTLSVFYWAAAKKYLNNGEVEWPQGAIALTYNELKNAVDANRARQ